MELYAQLTRLTYDYFIPLGVIFSFAIGSCIGSFLNVCIWRIPRGESLSHPGSHCPKCNYEIPSYQNIPIIAWLMLGGKCKSCKEPISARYIIIEAVTGIIFVLLTYRAKVVDFPVVHLLTIYYLTASFIAITFIDIKHLLIPGRITWTGTITALCFAVIFPYSIVTPVMHPLFNVTIDQQWMVMQWPFLAENPRVFAILFSGSGFIVGYCMVWVVVEAGKLLFGKQTFKYKEPIGITITSEGAQADDDELLLWEEMFDRKSDVLTIHIEEGRWETNNDEGELVKGILSFSHEGWTLNDQQYKLAEIKEINLK